MLPILHEIYYIKKRSILDGYSSSITILQTISPSTLIWNLDKDIIVPEWFAEVASKENPSNWLSTVFATKEISRRDQ